jgi:hypothetical protein
MSNLTPVALSFEQALKISFQEVPEVSRVKVYGVRYAFVKDSDENEFYITRLGWRLLENLRVENWYEGKLYAKKGERLVEGSGTVYRVPIEDSRGIESDMVVKFSRFAEAVPLHIAKTFPDKMPEDVGNAEFNDPFQEFGLLVDLRNGKYGPSDLRIKTKHPVAIFSPAQKQPAWKLGREKGRFDQYRIRMEKNIDPKYSRMDLELERQYIYMFAWVKGWNAANYMEWGKLTQEETRALTLRVEEELRLKGFKVLDNKPSHIILRENRHGELISRHGKLEYALVDFELLQRLPEYEDFLRQRGDPEELKA